MLQDPLPPKKYLLRAKDYWLDGQRNRALDLLERGTALYPNDMYLLSLAANYNIKCNRIDKAEALCHRVLAIDPRNLVTISTLGNALLQAQRYDEAITVLQDGRRIDPRNVVTISTLGNALLQARRYDEAITVLQDGRRIDPRDVVTISTLGNALLQAQRYDEAVAVLQDGRRIDPRNMVTINTLGNALLQAERYDEAVAVLQDGRRIDPRDMVTISTLGNALLQAERFDEAAQLFGDTAALGGEDKHWQSLRLNVAIRRAQRDPRHKAEADELASQVGRNDENCTLRYLAAKQHLISGRDGMAMQYIMPAVSAGDPNGTALFLAAADKDHPLLPHLQTAWGAGFAGLQEIARHFKNDPDLLDPDVGPTAKISAIYSGYDTAPVNRAAYKAVVPNRRSALRP